MTESADSPGNSQKIDNYQLKALIRPLYNWKIRSKPIKFDPNRTAVRLSMEFNLIYYGASGKRVMAITSLLAHNKDFIAHSLTVSNFDLLLNDSGYHGALYVTLFPV